ncbi:hypothetical protein JX265_014075 [Neoarthrinium moseri]|uniref:Uncharacterized protein n=1 Tax=Neoarthrinium moseri TaxID=1658444 RepID=A0A9P9W7G2_9PEZI|nr:hypothetical protein JX265_014075 [Neoarthrinium moseri]
MSSPVRRSNDCPTGKLWYTCAANGFRGCCSVDPCALTGCPDTQSESNDSTSSGFSSVFSSMNTQSLSAVPVITVTAVATNTAASTAPSAVAAPLQTSGLPTAAAVATGAGGMLFIMLACCLITWLIKKRNAEKEKTNREGGGEQEHLPPVTTEGAALQGVERLGVIEGDSQDGHSAACPPSHATFAELDGSEWSGEQQRHPTRNQTSVVSPVTPTGSLGIVHWGSAQWLMSRPQAVQSH